MKLSKVLRLLLAVALALSAVLTLASCEGDALVFGDYDFNDIDDHNPKYADKVYTVSFDSDGGGSVQSQSVARGGNATAPEDPAKLGYVFGGWYYKSIKWDFENYAVRSDMTLTAKWTKNNTVYSVKFDSLGGTAIPSQSIREGHYVLVPTEPKLADHRFGGWYVGEEAWDFSTQVASDMTLTAKWIPIVYYTVTFDLGAAEPVSPVTVAEGECAPLPEPALARHRFGGWYVGEAEWTADTPVTADVTLTAKWIPIVYYTVTFDSNGGSEVAALEVEAGTAATVPTKPILDGYRLLGWMYGEQMWDFSTPVTESITLTASWKQRPENLIYDVDTTPLNIIYTLDSRLRTREKAFEMLEKIEDERGAGAEWCLYHMTSIAEHEIVIGYTGPESDVNSREISRDAYDVLNGLAREDGMKYFVIYSNGSSVAIAFDEVEDESVGVTAIQYFMDNYVGEELALAPGTVYVGSVPYNGV